MLAGTSYQWQIARSHLYRIKDVLDRNIHGTRISADSENHPNELVRLEKYQGDIQLINVNFAHTIYSQPVLTDINIHIFSGQKVVIVGPTGSGKTTLALILLGIYQHTQGTVLYDGVDKSRVDIDYLRSKVGVVLQDMFLIEGTVRDNVRFGNGEIDEINLREALEFSVVDKEIYNLPLGTETFLGSGSKGLSSGQIQRICIARAIAQNPTLLIMDEATSHLDEITQSKIHDNIDKLSCTRIIISHRPSVIKNADQIIVMDQGRICQVGTHEGLNNVEGLYRDLFNLNLR